MSHSSIRGLFTLVSRVEGAEASCDVLKKEFEERSHLLFSGISYSADSKKSTAPKRKHLSENFEAFLSKLGSFLDKGPEDTWNILSCYLSGDFRGTRDSLKHLIDQERLQKPLMVDIWQFYRAERLYLLQVLKQVLGNQCNESHKYYKAFRFLIDLWKKEGSGEDPLKKSLISQLKSVFNEEWEKSPDYHNTWIKYNLREQTELLQLILLHFHASSLSNSTFNQDLKDLLDLFRTQGFGQRQIEKVDPGLVSSVGQLQSIISVYLMNLPKLTLSQNKDSESESSKSDDSSDEEFLDYSFISSLGSIPDHGPIMLAWMLARYLKNGELTQAEMSIGERAVQLRVLHYLNSVLTNDVITNQTVKSIAAGVCYSVLSVLITVFDPDRMGLGMDIHNTTQLVLKENLIASNFWKQGFDTGLGFVLGGYLTKFPVTLKPVLEICISLAGASPKSAREVINILQNLMSYTELVERVDPEILQPFGDKWISLEDRYPYPNSNSIVIPTKSKAQSDGILFQWKLRLNGWQLFLCEIDCLIKQASLGAKNVSESGLASVTAITKLVDTILRSHTGVTTIHSMEHLVESFYVLIEKFVQAPAPPIDLLANCLSCLAVVAQTRPVVVWERLSSTGLFPHLARSHLDILGTSKSADINPGVIGALLAQQECVYGEYPLTNAFLDLLLHCASTDKAVKISPSLLYIVREMLPAFQQWRFVHSTNKPIFGQKILKVCFSIMSSALHNEEEEEEVNLHDTESEKSTPAHPDKKLLCEALLNPAPCETLFNLIGIGDKAIQSVLEDQSSWEFGLGTELVKLVDLVLRVLEVLIRDRRNSTTDFQELLCSSPFPSGVQPQPRQPHFLLTIAHYVYHFQNPNIPISAVRLLSTVAGVFPMSLLACLGSEAEAFRDVLIARLESHTEDVRLKIAIIDFFSACVENQPGLVQLLIGGGKRAAIEEEKKVGEKGKETTEKKFLQVMDKGCLKSVLTVMEHEAQSHPDLLMAVLNLVLNLWNHQRVVATSFLKKQNRFWKNLSEPLFKENDNKSINQKSRKLCAYILRIISAEIFAFGGKVDPELKSVLNDFVSDKNEYLNEWNSRVLREKDNFLLGAWKTFLILLTRDQPVSVTPSQCHSVAKGLVDAVKSGLSQSPKGIRTTTSLSEMTLVLVQTWMTKCAGNMEKWVLDHSQVLEQMVSVYENLHVRTKNSVLGMVHTALKTSSFKMENEDKSLSSWIQPAVEIVLLSSNEVSEILSEPKKDIKVGLQVPILAVSLLRKLINRLSSSSSWFSIWRESSLTQSLLSVLEHCLRHRCGSGFIVSLLDLLIVVASTSEDCCHSLLVSDLCQSLWLPLSDINPYASVPLAEESSIEDWCSVFRLSLRFAACLLRVGKQHAVSESITAISLLQDRLSSFLIMLPPINNIKGVGHLELTSAAASFISLLAPYYRQWQLQHSMSLYHFFRRMSSLIHGGVSLIIRPSLLSALLLQSHDPSMDQYPRRVRRLSSTDQETMEHSSPETAHIQCRLLDIVSSCLRMFRSLSPDITSLASVEDLLDPAQWESLIAITFSSPTFDDDSSDGVLTYGTLISVANFCVRSITRSDRSPSPSSSGDKEFGLHGPDKRRLLLVFEQAVILILVQSLLSLRNPDVSSRDKQLLRRELGAELGSFVESMRRFVQRSSRSPITTAGSSHRVSASSPAVGINKSYDRFIKLIASIVQNVYK